MKRAATWAVLVVLAASLSAAAAGLISKTQAEQDALKAVHGGTVIQAVLDTQGTTRIWSVDIAQPAHEYEVHVDAHTGKILRIIVQPAGAPLNGAAMLLSRPEAEQIAMSAAGGGTVQEVKLEKEADRKVWSVDVSSAEAETQVRLDAYSGQVLKVITQPAAAQCKFISKATAEKAALAAVGGGNVLLAVLESQDHPPVWSVDTANARGEFEVKVNACTAKIVAIVPGG